MAIGSEGDVFHRDRGLPLCQHAALVKEELASRRVLDGAQHPWEVEYQGWPRKNEHLLSEETYWLELSNID